MAMNEWKFTLLIYGLCMFSEGKNINQSVTLIAKVPFICKILNIHTV